MTTEEFSNEFDTLISNYVNARGFGEGQSPLEFDEYEKSLFLTEAQEDLIRETYSGKNNVGDSFESSEEVRRYLDNLIKTNTLEKCKSENLGLSTISSFYRLPNDLWYITYESVTLESKDSSCIDNKNIVVTPVSQDEYFRIKENPFRQANTRRALRLDCGNNNVEIISTYPIKQYLIRYLCEPSPIILTDLPDELKINNLNTKTECLLNSAVHGLILERAVQKALTSRSFSTARKNV